MATGRRYERYDVDYVGNKNLQPKAVIEGQVVTIINFSVGGVYVASKKPFVVDEIVSAVIDLKERGKISLMGKIARVHAEGEKWGAAIDFCDFKK